MTTTTHRMGATLPTTTDSALVPTLETNPLQWQALLMDDLAAVERILEESLQNKHPRVAEVLAHVQHYRGKRLRPAMLLLTAKACGKVIPAHHVLGAAVEMIHTATLVHDDVLDNASVRRHVRTVHSKWGTSASVLLGDHLFTHAFHLTSTTGDARACEIIGEATNATCEGELRQNLEVGNLDLSEDDYFEIIRGKTAELIACSCRLGAHYSGADEVTVESMAQYGRHLGMAFQIADDVLDLVGEEKTTGKSLGTDVEQQKLTLPVLWLLRHCGDEVAMQTRTILTGEGNHKREAMMRLFHRTDALEQAKRIAEEHAQKARQQLNHLTSSAWRTVLEKLTEQVIHRDR